MSRSLASIGKGPSRYPEFMPARMNHSSMLVTSGTNEFKVLLSGMTFFVIILNGIVRRPLDEWRRVSRPAGDDPTGWETCPDPRPMSRPPFLDADRRSLLWEYLVPYTYIVREMAFSVA